MELAPSDLGGGEKNCLRRRRLDFALAQALQKMIRASGESLADDVTLAARDCSSEGKVLRGHQIVWMLVDYFKTNRSLQEQFTWQGTESLSIAWAR